MARHQDRGFDGRRRPDRAGDEGRGQYGREEDDRRPTMEERRWEDEPWASRERGGWGESERDWPRREYSGGGARPGERWTWQPEGSRGGYEQGGYWQSEAARRGQGGYGPGSYYGQGQVEYGQRGSAPGGRWSDGPQGFGDRDWGGRSFSGREWGHRDFGDREFGQPDFSQRGHGNSGDRGWIGRLGSGMPEHGPYAGRGPKGYQRSDERIKEDLCERLTQHGDIDASEIEVKVSNREITLAGTVASRQAKRMAEDIAESVSGVTEVNNQLRVSHEAGGPPIQTQGGQKAGREGQHSTTRAA